MQLMTEMMQGQPTTKVPRMIAAMLQSIDDPQLLAQVNKLLVGKFDESNQAKMLAAQVCAASRFVGERHIQSTMPSQSTTSTIHN